MAAKTQSPAGGGPPSLSVRSRGGDSRSRILDGVAKDKKRDVENVDVRGSPEEKMARVEEVAAEATPNEAEMGALKLAELADAGIAVGVPAVSSSSSSSTIVVPLALPIVSQPSEPSLSLSLSLAAPALIKSETQLVRQLNDDAIEDFDGKGSRKNFGKLTNVQTMITEMKKANALATNTVKSNKSFVQDTLGFLQGQQTQISEILSVMSAGFAATGAAVQAQKNTHVPEKSVEEKQAAAIKILFGDNPTEQQLAQLKSISSIGSAQSSATSIVHFGAEQLGAAQPGGEPTPPASPRDHGAAAANIDSGAGEFTGIRPSAIADSLSDDHKKLLAQSSRKFEKKLTGYIRLGEKIAKLQEEIKILQKNEYPPSVRPVRYPDTAVELEWLFEESRSEDYVVPGFIIPAGCKRRDALVLLKKKYEQAVKVILLQGSLELLKLRDEDISENKFGLMLDEVEDPVFVADRDQKFPNVPPKHLPPLKTLNEELYNTEKGRLYKVAIESCIKKWQSRKTGRDAAAADEAPKEEAVSENPVTSLLKLIDRRAEAIVKGISVSHGGEVDASSPEFDDMDDQDRDDDDEKDTQLLSTFLPDASASSKDVPKNGGGPSAKEPGKKKQPKKKATKKKKDTVPTQAAVVKTAEQKEAAKKKKKAAKERKRKKAEDQTTADANLTGNSSRKGKGKDKGKGKGKGNGTWIPSTKGKGPKGKGKGKGKFHDKGGGKGKGKGKSGVKGSWESYQTGGKGKGSGLKGKNSQPWRGTWHSPWW